MGQREKYENKNFAYRFAVERFLRRVAGAAASLPFPARRILDVGCAEGFVIKYLKERRSKSELPELSEFYGIDVDSGALEEARKMNPGVFFEQRSVFDAGAIGKNFDLVLVLEVLEHLKNFDLALAALKSVNSDYFLFSVPREPFFRGINFLRGRYWNRWGNIPEHVNAWSKGKFRKIISAHFEIIGDFSCFPWTIFLAKKR